MATEPDKLDSDQRESNEASPPADSGKVSLKVALKELDSITLSLQAIGMMVVLLAGVTLACIVAMGVLQVFPVISAVRLGAAAFTILSAFQGLVMLLRWEKRRKEGMVLYEEVSDEVEWRHRSQLKPKVGVINPKARRRAGLSIRLALRRFLSSTDLPFTPRQASGVAYTVYFIVCIMLVVLILVLAERGSFSWHI
jgi:hypothetical protein